MISAATQRLQVLCDLIPPLLRAVDEAAFSAKPAPDKWSRKEILGHLIDSAANNHQRFVRGQFETMPHIVYDPDAWTAHSYYARLDSVRLVAFWEAYNRHLAELVQQIPEPLLARTVDTGDAAPKTLDFLIDDYVVHLEHHLREIVNY